MRAVPPLPDFPSITHDKLRYGDTDRQGHVNNAVFTTFFETGRVEMLFLGAPETPEFVIVNLTLDYLAEVHWPGTVDIGSGVADIGRSSVRLRQAAYQDGRPVATALATIVMLDPETRRAAPLTEELRALFETFRMPSGS